MRVVIFSWEYPPRVVGKLAAYVDALAGQLVKRKVDTYVVTYHDTLTGETTEANGAKVTRVNNPVHDHVSLLTWDLTLNEEVERAASNIYYQNYKHIDLIDVHDWHFIPAAAVLKNALHIPFVYSVDSLEDHRSPGSDTPFNMAIRGVEWLGFYEAADVVVKSEWMRDEVARIYKVPVDKIRVVHPDKPAWIREVLNGYQETLMGGQAGGT